VYYSALFEKEVRNIPKLILESDLRSRYGGMMKASDIKGELGLQRAAVAKWVKDLKYVEVNGRKKYPVAEVAKKIIGNTHEAEE
jgi:predicted transcriptional regulator